MVAAHYYVFVRFVNAIPFFSSEQAFSRRLEIRLGSWMLLQARTVLGDKATRHLLQQFSVQGIGNNCPALRARTSISCPVAAAEACQYFRRQDPMDLEATLFIICGLPGAVRRRSQNRLRYLFQQSECPRMTG